ncbi:MAG: hypothetical protein GFH27_549313n121 [Chloroflexi bacterium AL-W]|nr:hypothetical protein [Chloroflexi bacterium AL-N1]NOK69544.1 hypothetical protein [Chloroflexi bacterium AL-N10]NOK77509.1 hypothetical protein [Chloroflexi bacterium AL-N5]NOK84360.1 hypothetical protein [Chloroflexi bacterium AL-W]NOK91474.1 hypothetical protein [Chloroflexi bacterium AL-N15]
MTRVHTLIEANIDEVIALDQAEGYLTFYRYTTKPNSAATYSTCGGYLDCRIRDQAISSVVMEEYSRNDIWRCIH